MASNLMMIQICEMSAFEILITFLIKVNFKETMDCSKITRASNWHKRNISHLTSKLLRLCTAESVIGKNSCHRG